ncbi:hypothetical protein CORC01_01037 [Colletotrichum orchidophilum]|uniref:HNH nuclease domain-containing protein n=1 Tax=Colletotrichum orchidophilum TaxID=1209926 RepID=A0A1G4BQW2_9PEZI|nr:uncharacterized protein CORC01_01037 [Colletotrichum orchidophilum]OHF03718.1 hypothetical protein CORC01_01037 [Colletotrichum orchidophilum]
MDALFSAVDVEQLKLGLQKLLQRNNSDYTPTFRDTETLTRFFSSNVRRHMCSHTDNEYLGDEGEIDLAERFAIVHETRTTILHHEYTKHLKAKAAALEKLEVWAHLMVLSLPRLREFASKVQNDPEFIFGLHQAFESMNQLLWFLRAPPPKWDKKKTGIIQRKESVRVATLARDHGICVLTGSLNSERCHIVPFWTLNRPSCINAIDAAYTVYGVERMMILQKKLCDEDTNIVDSPSNVITLSRSLHKFWDQGLFGLEPVCHLFEKDKKAAGINEGEADEESGTPGPSTPSKLGVKRSIDRIEKSPSKKTKGQEKEEAKEDIETKEKTIGIRIRFHWLRRTTGVTPDTLPNDMAALRLKWDPRNPSVIVHDVNGRPLDDGHLVDIYDIEDAKAPDLQILQLQWDVFRMHALAGGADPNIYAPDWYYDEDGGKIFEPPPEKIQALQAMEARKASTASPQGSKPVAHLLQPTPSGQDAVNTSNTEMPHAEKPSRIATIKRHASRLLRRRGQNNDSQVSDSAPGSHSPAKLQVGTTVEAGADLDSPSSEKENTYRTFPSSEHPDENLDENRKRPLSTENLNVPSGSGRQMTLALRPREEEDA